MKKQAIVLLLFLSATFMWAAKPAPTPASPIDVLKDQAPNLIEWALAPLNQPVPPDIRQSLTFLREGLLDEGKGDPKTGIDAYRQGYRLCQSLLGAYDDRDEAQARAGIITVQATANNAAPTSIALEVRRNFKFSWPQYKKEQAERGELHQKSKADTNAVAERLKGEWVTTVIQMRTRLDNTYARFREALRANANFKPVIVAETSNPPEISPAKKETLKPASVTPPTTATTVSSKKPKPSPPARLTSASQQSPFVNSLGMKFVPVPGTTVLFCIHDTRKGDYRQYAEAKPGVDDSWKTVKNKEGLPVSEGEDHPVVMVSWDDAQSFCQWLSAKEGRTYRLPTDDEWSWAAGIGEKEDQDELPQSKNDQHKHAFAWGHKWPPPDGAGNFADMTLQEKLPAHRILEGYRDGYATTSPVMTYKPNDFGLYDMGGNVYQWCEDWLDAKQKKRVLRGATYGTRDHDALLSSHRDGHGPGYRGAGMGFRVVVVQ